MPASMARHCDQMTGAVADNNFNRDALASCLRGDNCIDFPAKSALLMPADAKQEHNKQAIFQLFHKRLLITKHQANFKIKR
jgi:hypothetical protein